jgi:hypothetical protein
MKNKVMPKYFAHSTKSKDKNEWQCLEAHLQNVAKMAKRFSSVSGADNWAKYPAFCMMPVRQQLLFSVDWTDAPTELIIQPMVQKWLKMSSCYSSAKNSGLTQIRKNYFDNP